MIFLGFEPKSSRNATRRFAVNFQSICVELNIQCMPIALRSFCRNGCRPGRTRRCLACRKDSVLRAYVCMVQAASHRSAPPTACKPIHVLGITTSRAVQSCARRDPGCLRTSTRIRRCSERCSLQMRALWVHDEAPSRLSAPVHASRVAWPCLKQPEPLARAEMSSRSV